MKAHFRMMAAYNAWANRRLFDAAGRLPEADYRADLGAFFGSVEGTLNHLLVGDGIWMARFTGDPPPPWRLDTRPHADLATLHAAREALDRRIAAHVDALTEAEIAGALVYRDMAGREFRQPRAEALAHFFNHQTHHRGQIHALLTRLTGAAPELDLIYHIREAA
jgi:uncharacterized damage-inducible protein DinB